MTSFLSLYVYGNGIHPHLRSRPPRCCVYSPYTERCRISLTMLPSWDGEREEGLWRGGLNAGRRSTNPIPINMVQSSSHLLHYLSLLKMHSVLF